VAGIAAEVHEGGVGGTNQQLRNVTARAVGHVVCCVVQAGNMAGGAKSETEWLEGRKWARRRCPVAWQNGRGNWRARRRQTQNGGVGTGNAVVAAWLVRRKSQRQTLRCRWCRWHRAKAHGVAEACRGGGSGGLVGSAGVASTRQRSRLVCLWCGHGTKPTIRQQPAQATNVVVSAVNAGTNRELWQWKQAPEWGGRHHEGERFTMSL